MGGSLGKLARKCLEKASGGLGLRSSEITALTLARQ